MIEEHKQYYQEMLKKDKLFPFIHEGKMWGFLTYYIGNDNTDKYVRDDMWSVLEDESETGNICYVDHYITTKNKANPRLSFGAWRDFKNYIRDKHPLIKYFRHNRYKEKWNKPKVFKQGGTNALHSSSINK